MSLLHVGWLRSLVQLWISSVRKMGLAAFLCMLCSDLFSCTLLLSLEFSTMHYLKCQALSVRACTFCVITVLIFRVLTCRRDIPVLLNIIISTLLYPLKMWIMLVDFYWQCKLKKILLNDRAVRSSMSMWSYLTILRPPQNSMRHHSCGRTAKLNGLIKRNGHHLNASGALA